MATWSEFAQSSLEISRLGRKRLFQFGPGLAFRLQIECALYSGYKPRGEPDNWPPEYLKWSAA